VIYFASPYTHVDPAISNIRYHAVMRETAHFLKLGYPVYSPIVHAHVMAFEYSLPRDYQFWKPHNHALLRRSLELWFLTIDGWRESAGVQGELELARELGIPITRKDPRSEREPL